MVHSADPHRRGGRKKPRGGRGDPGRTGPAAPSRDTPADPRGPGFDEPGEPEYDGPAWPEPAAGPQPRGALEVSRRKLLVSGGGLAAAFAGLETMRHLAATPIRLAVDREAIRQRFPGPSNLPDVQFDLSSFIAPAQTVDGVVVAFPPVYTLFAPARLRSAPSREDARQLSDALDRIEQAYAFEPQGAFTFVSYGMPYFSRFPGRMFSTLVPRLTSDNSRFALEEAVPGPTDVSPGNPGITKETFNVPVRIEQNDMLITLRSDHVDHLWDVMAFLAGSNRLGGERVPSPRLGCGLTFTSARVMFVQRGLPRSVADSNSLPYASYVNPQSPMWMGFADQQTNASAPAPNVTFQGAGGIKLTTAEPGDYFDNGSLQHLSHVILDMAQFFDLDASGKPGDDGTFLERVQYMFRSTPPPSQGNADQFTNGGGPSFLENDFQGTGDAQRSAEGIGTPIDPDTGKPAHRMGHLSTLQRSSRTAAGQPIHVRMDGPGFDSLDVPDGSKQPKLEFTAFVPSADFFATMRRNQASLDLQKKFGVEASDNGLERFITATRRQNYLMPPRRHRAFPFAELGRRHD